MANMHIVFIDTTLKTPPTGGAQTFLVTLCEGLVQRGWKVSVVTDDGPDHSIVEALAGTRTEIVENLWKPTHLPEERATRLADWINRNHPALYAISISPDVGWLALPLLNSNIATLSVAHCDVRAFYEPVAHYHSFIDCAVAVSEEIYRKTIAGCNIPAERARQIPYGIEPLKAEKIVSRCAADHVGPLRIGYIGRLEQEQKRVMDFVPLVLELKKRRVEFELHLIGDGSSRPFLEEELRRQLPSEMVVFWGWLSSEGVSERLLELDVYILMSAFEGLPVALLEAMGHGVAPVVSRIASGNAEVVRDGENGFIAAVGDVMAFADRLETLGRDRELLRSMRKAAWEVSCDYSALRMVERYLDCFQHLTSSEFCRKHRKTPPNPYPLMPSCRSPYPIWLRKVKRRFLTAIHT